MKFVGLFRELDHSSTILFPSLYEIRGTMSPEIAQKIAHHLRQGTILVHERDWIPDPFKKRRSIDPGMATDGTWAWNNYLIYLVEEHHIQLDEEFVQDVLLSRIPFFPKESFTYCYKQIIDQIFIARKQKSELEPPTVTYQETTMKVIGLFKELEPKTKSKLPSIFDASYKLHPEVAQKISNYLKNGTVVIDVIGFSSDPFHKFSSDRYAIQTYDSIASDGRWIWRMDLAYYVEKYRVQIEEDVIKHILYSPLPLIPESTILSQIEEISQIYQNTFYPEN